MQLTLRGNAIDFFCEGHSGFQGGGVGVKKVSNLHLFMRRLCVDCLRQMSCVLGTVGGGRERVLSCVDLGFGWGVRLSLGGDRWGRG